MTKNDIKQQKQSTLPIILFTILALILIFALLNKGSQQEINDLVLDNNYLLDNTQVQNQTPEEDLHESENSPETINNNQEDIKESSNMINRTRMPKPELTIKADQNYFATISTNQGEIKLRLFADITPVTVNNFVYLANAGFYNGLIFHRIIDDFMIQGGCPLGNGTGSPGYQFEDEPNEMPLVKGSLAMANSGPNTNGSQFFIVTADETPWLDGKHTNFGEVVEGMDVLDKINKAPTEANDQPTFPVNINSISIEVE